MYPPPWIWVTFRKLTSDYSFRTNWDETEYALISFLTVCSLFLKEHIMALDRIFPGATHTDNNSWVGTGSWEKKSLAIHHLWHGMDTKTGLRAEVIALSPVCYQLLSFWLIRQSTMFVNENVGNESPAQKWACGNHLCCKSSHHIEWVRFLPFKVTVMICH